MSSSASLKQPNTLGVERRAKSETEQNEIWGGRSRVTKTGGGGQHLFANPETPSPTRSSTSSVPNSLRVWFHTKDLRPTLHLVVKVLSVCMMATRASTRSTRLRSSPPQALEQRSTAGQSSSRRKRHAPIEAAAGVFQRLDDETARIVLSYLSPACLVDR